MDGWLDGIGECSSVHFLSGWLEGQLVEVRRFGLVTCILLAYSTVEGGGRGRLGWVIC